jgi:hypothetical protein
MSDTPAPPNVPPIPSMWLNSDTPRHSISKPSATTTDTVNTLPGPETVGNLTRSKSTGPGTKIRTLIRHGSETFLRRAPLAGRPVANPMPEPDGLVEELDVEVPRTTFAPNTVPPSFPKRSNTGSRFVESASICSYGAEPSLGSPVPAQAGAGISLPSRVLSVSHMSRLRRFKTMTKRYSLALHPFGVRKVS